MAKEEKFTLKVSKERTNILAHNMNALKSMIDNIGVAFANYLRFKGEEDDFKKYLENQNNVDKLKESEKNDKK
tara:strand:- start:736 stop:954 length:219 start_codon:yes stop_codon:yes gene_type:complete